MRHQHQRAAKFQQALFQYFERRNVEVVGRLVEQQQVGGLQHQLSDQHARAFASGKLADRAIQVFAGERETLAPSRHVNHAVLVDHRVAVGRERAAQRQIRIELAVLVEVDDAQRRRPSDLAAAWARYRRAAGAAAWSCRCRWARPGPRASLP